MSLLAAVPDRDLNGRASKAMGLVSWGYIPCVSADGYARLFLHLIYHSLRSRIDSLIRQCLQQWRQKLVRFTFCIGAAYLSSSCIA